MTTNTIPDRATWYVRSAIHRGVLSTLDQVEQGLDALDKHPDIAETFRESIRGMCSYNMQWLSETRAALRGNEIDTDIVGDDFTWSEFDRRYPELVEQLKKSK